MDVQEGAELADAIWNFDLRRAFCCCAEREGEVSPWTEMGIGFSGSDALLATSVPSICGCIEGTRLRSSFKTEAQSRKQLSLREGLNFDWRMSGKSLLLAVERLKILARRGTSGNFASTHVALKGRKT